MRNHDGGTLPWAMSEVGPCELVTLADRMRREGKTDGRICTVECHHDYQAGNFHRQCECVCHEREKQGRMEDEEESLMVHG